LHSSIIGDFIHFCEAEMAMLSGKSLSGMNVGRRKDTSRLKAGLFYLPVGWSYFF